MLAEVIRQWDDNKDALRRHIATNKDRYERINYDDLVRDVVDIVLNGGDAPVRYDSNAMTVIDDGDYQGSMIFAIPEDTYQPSPDEYLFTYVYYGSCSGCDTLQAVQGERYDPMLFVDEFMTLALHLIQNMKRL